MVDLLVPQLDVIRYLYVYRTAVLILANQLYSYCLLWLHWYIHSSRVTIHRGMYTVLYTSSMMYALQPVYQVKLMSTLCTGIVSWCGAPRMTNVRHPRCRARRGVMVPALQRHSTVHVPVRIRVGILLRVL